MPKSKHICLGIWIALNLALAFCYRLLPTAYQLPTVLFWTAFITPLYVETTHDLDQRKSWRGLRHLRSLMKDSRSSPFRKTLRLEMLAINSGFAATFFLLSLQLLLDSENASGQFPILVVMVALFFLATILNILQLILYDFRLAVEGHSNYGAIAGSIKSRLTMFGQLAWHFQIAAVIVGFALIHIDFCIAMNTLYGSLLFAYYFLNFDEAAPPIEAAGPGSEEVAYRVERLEQAQAEMRRQIDQTQLELRKPLTVTIKR